MQMDRRQIGAKLLPYALLGLVMLLWAGNGIVGRAVRFDVGPFTFTFGRWLLAVLFVAPFAVRPVLADWGGILRAWKFILFMGIVGIGAFNALIYNGLRHTTATNALLLSAAMPALVALFERVLFGTRPSRWHFLGMALSVAGVVLIAFEGDLSAASQLQFGKGDLYILAAVAVWSLYTVMLRFILPIAPISFVAATFLTGMVCMAPFAMWEWHVGVPFNLDADLAAAFLYVALLPSLFCFFAYNWAARRIGAVQAGQMNNSLPVFGALLASLLLGEKLHFYHFTGMAFILAGITISALMRRGEQAAGAG